MLLSSVRRLRLYCAGEGDDPVSSELKNTRSLSMWLASVSSTVEWHLKRPILIDAYTDYFDIRAAKIEYWLNAYPLYSMVDAYEEPRALWTGYEREIQYVIPGPYRNSIVTPFAFTYVQQRALRIRYVGGLAYHAVNSKYAISSTTGTFTVGSIVQGQSSLAVGYVVAVDASTITIEVYYGIFTPGEIVKQFTDETFTAPASATTTINLYGHYGFYSFSGKWYAGKYVKGQLSGAIGQISALEGSPTNSLYITMTSGAFIEGEYVAEYDDAACTVLTDTTGTMSPTTSAAITYINHRALCEVAPELVTAVEAQVRFMRKHALDFENAGTNKDGTTVRAGRQGKSNVLLDEIRGMLQPYRRDWGF